MPFNFKPREGDFDETLIVGFTPIGLQKVGDNQVVVYAHHIAHGFQQVLGHFNVYPNHVEYDNGFISGCADNQHKAIFHLLNWAEESILRNQSQQGK